MYILIFLQGHFNSVKRFYEECGYPLSYIAALNTDDTILVARDETGRIMAVVRLCIEEDYVVLRGMQVRKEYRRKDVGTKLLEEFVKVLGERACFCLPYSHLVEFYKQVGFEQVEESEAPPHLQTRLKEYREGSFEGKFYIVMKRPQRPS